MDVLADTAHPTALDDDRHPGWPVPPGRAPTRAPATATREPRPAPPGGDGHDAALLFASIRPLVERRSVVVHLLGAGPRVGTTRVARALADAASRQRWCRTLLVDASARPSDDGAPSLLARHRAAAALPPIDPNRPVLLAGPADQPPRPTELAALYDTLRPRFDLVVVDGDTPDRSPDAAILSAAADLVLLVVRAEHSRADAVTRTRALLDAGGARRLGLVLTGRRRRLPALLERLL